MGKVVNGMNYDKVSITKKENNIYFVDFYVGFYSDHDHVAHFDKEQLVELRDSINDLLKEE